MSRAKLKKRILCALAAASVVTFAHEGGQIEAAEPDHILITNDKMTEDLVTPPNGGYIYGITGGDTYIDAGLDSTLGSANNFIDSDLGKIIGYFVQEINDVGTIIETVQDKTEGASGDVSSGGNAGLTLEDYGYNWIRYYGAVGGDISVNTGIKGNIDKFTIGNVNPGISLPTESKDMTITHNGDVKNTITGGSVLIGSGGSAAIAVGNIKASADGGVAVGSTSDYIVVDAEVSFDGKTTTIINGDVTTNSEGDANLVGWTNGGLAAAIGGTAVSEVTGDTTLTIDGTDKSDHEGSYENPEDDAISPITTVLNVMKGSKVSAVGVAGGGTAVSTFGDTADSTVGGSTTVNVNNATVIGVAGGGVAASVDATGIANELIPSDSAGFKRYGSNDGTVTITGSQLEDLTGASLPDDLTITINDAIDGGTATSTTGDTNINLTGTTTAVGVAGGGVAVAYQDYRERDDDSQLQTGDILGTGEATATTGKATINVDLDSSNLDKGKVVDAVSDFIGGIASDATQADSLEGLKDQGAVFGITGGGIAVGVGSAGSVDDSEDKGASATATTTGADINLNSGYAAGVFGGGAAATVNDASATAEMTDTVNITTAEGMETVGIFGGGAAVTMENGQNTSSGSSGSAYASSTVDEVNITNEGTTDGIFGGGVAFGNTNFNHDDYDAEATVNTANITINGGEVNNVNLQPLMDATKNDNDDGYPWWNRLGYNASGILVDLKGITDETAIAGGGLGLGMSGYSDVDTVNITVNDGTVNGDILGGGIAVDNYTEGSGSYVGTSTITVNGGEIDGSIYAGGAINKTTSEATGKYDTDNTSSKVDTAEVILNGATVTGEISGQGYEVETNYSQDGNFNPYYDGNEITYTKDIYDSVGESTLTITGENTLTPLDNSDGEYTSDSKIHDFDYVNVEDGSTTILDSSIEAGDTPLIDGGLITVSDTAYLDISNLEATSDAEYNIAGNYKEGSTFWSNDNMIYDRLEYYATGNETDERVNIKGNEYNNLYSISFEELNEENKQAAAESMGNLINAGPLQPIVDEGFRLYWDTDKGISEGGREYFSDWSNHPQANNAYRRGTLIGEDSGVTASAVSIAGDIADIVAEHFSFTEDPILEYGPIMADGGIWARYINKSYETSGMGSTFGNLSADTDYDGVIVGVDFDKKGKFQSGIAAHYGEGDSTGSFSRNDFDAYGAAFYGSIKDEEARTNLMFDFGYTKTSNDLTGYVNGSRMTADRDLDVWTLGVRGEKEFVFGDNQIVPYIGLRYMYVDPSSYSSYYNGKKAFKYDADDQDIWLLPVGVSFRNESKTDDGWSITPKVDLAYIWAFGDTDSSVNIGLAGATAPLNYDVMDDGSWLAAVGLEASYNAWTFGAGYAYQKGDDTKNRTWYISANYAF